MTVPPKKPATAAAVARREATPDLVRQALACIPADIGHDERVRMAFAVFDGIGETGADLWLDWAGSRAQPDRAEDLAVWRSARKPGRTKVGSLFGLAKDHGFKFPEGGRAAPGPSAEVLAARAEAKRLQLEAEEAELLAKREQSALRSQLLWDGAKAAPTGSGCPYLDRKGVQAHGLRFLPGGTALVPMRDANGRLWSVQRLLPKPLRDSDTGQAGTDKLYGPPKQDPGEQVSSRKLGLWHWIGQPVAAPVFLLAEGYATGASLFEATGRPVAVCFDAGNLVHVARELRRLYPAAFLMLCGDDDRGTEARRGKNPGREAAHKAAAAAAVAGGLVGVVFPAGLPEDQKDWNDLARLSGLAEVAGQVERAIAAPLPLAEPASKPTKARQRATSAAGAGEGAQTPAPPPPGPPMHDAEAQEPDHFGFYVDADGVWHVGRDRDGKPKRPQWLCGPLKVGAITSDEHGNGFGYLLEFTNRFGAPRQWAAPAALFNGDSTDWAARLRDMGLKMDYGGAARNLVGRYIDSREPGHRATCVDKVGWHDGVFVLPERCIGDARGRRFIFQSDGLVDDLFKVAGDLAEWRASLARRCAGNSRLVFAVCAALAGPTMRLTGLATGGFHLLGDSSLGKSTALLVAASVWGPSGFKQQWRATDNGLEGLALQHNDSTLILDEISQMDSRTIGEAVYMLSNEADKVRNSQKILLRKRKTWRLLFLSSGEKSLADHMAESGKKPNEGQLLRMPSVPADAGQGMGMFEQIHDAESPKAFAELLERTAARLYGSAGDRWLRWLCANQHDLNENWAQDRADLVVRMTPAHAHPQVLRVATRFAQVGLVGEHATKAGITGWQAGEAEAAAIACFEAWLSVRGHVGGGEQVAMLAQVRAFLEKNGELMFTWMHRGMDDHRPNTAMRAGFRRVVDDQGQPLKMDAATEYVDKFASDESKELRLAQVEYLVLPQAFERELCKGFRAEAVAALLRAKGHLRSDKDRLTMKQRLPGMGKAPCYVIKPTIFSEGE